MVLFRPLRQPLPKPSLSPRSSISNEERNAELLNRATNGFTEDEFARLNSIGRAGWFRQQLVPTGPDTQELQDALASIDTQQFVGAAYYLDNEADKFAALRDVLRSTMSRSVYSKFQLRERMVDFWHDHFSVTANSTGDTRLGHFAYDKDVIRAHVFGNFKDMLQASARSVSMLNYLNGRENVAGSPNENYSREVMELHTLGVNGGYTEQDVVELARCFTGWTYFNLDEPNVAGDFRFRSERHDDDAKTVLGVQIPAGGGVQDGVQMLTFLAEHDDTIDYVSRKLVRRFISESVPEIAVEQVKSAWIRSNGDLRIITAILFSDGLADLVEPWNEPKVKRPFQYFAGLFRAAGIQTSDALDNMRFRLGTMGQPLFDWPAPDGYPDSSAAWSGSAASRWEFAAAIFRGNVSGIDVSNQELVRMQAGVPITELAQRLNILFTGGFSAPSTVTNLQAWIDSRANFGPNDFRDALTVMASSPDFLMA